LLLAKMQTLLCSSVLLVVASFVASAKGQGEIELFPLRDKYSVTAGDASCSAATGAFPTAWTNTTCYSDATLDANFLSFKVGFTKFGPFKQTEWDGINTSAACFKAANALDGGLLPILQGRAICYKLQDSTYNCLCNRLECATDEANKAVTPETAAVCNPHGKKVCDFFRTEVDSVCLLFAGPQNFFGDAAAWDHTLVPMVCNPDKCKAATVVPMSTTPAPTTTSRNPSASSTTASSAGLKVSYAAVAAAAALAGVSAAL